MIKRAMVVTSATELNVATALWRRSAAYAHLAAVMGPSLRRHCRHTSMRICLLACACLPAVMLVICTAIYYVSSERHADVMRNNNARANP